MDADRPPQRGASSSGVQPRSIEEIRETAAYAWTRDILLAVFLTAALSVSLVAAVGVWPPLAAVTSGSMEPALEPGDVVILMEPTRLPPEAADEHGIVTRRQAVSSDHSSLGKPGTVMVFRSYDEDPQGTVHRAMFYVEEGENWYPRADEQYVHGAESCSALRNCPAPHAGYITKGDANPAYDQALGMAPPVQEKWIVGSVRGSIPDLGWLRIVAL